MRILFWTFLILPFYSYFLYPVLLYILGTLSSLSAGNDEDGLELNPNEIDDADWPSVAILISAHNEERVIAERVANALGQDYPADKIKVIVGSDGSSDSTEEILGRIKEPRFKAFLYSRNRGKASVLNDLAAEATADVLVFSDANTRFEANAIKWLAVHFADERVGCVSGELNLLDDAQNGNSDAIYWRYEQFVKRYESKLNALVGANGAIYGIRRELFPKVPADTVIDDLIISLYSVRRGFRSKYEPRAQAEETLAPTIDDEAKRRIRIGSGNYQAFFRMPWALNPFKGTFFFSYLSHKVLRWFTPHFLMFAFAINLFLIAEPIHFGVLVLTLFMGALAVIGYRRSISGKRNPTVVNILVFVVVMNISLLIGFYKYMFSDLSGRWERTSR